MKTIQVNAYYFHELSEEVQYKIIENNRETICDREMQLIHDEMEKSIKKFMYFVSAYVNGCGGLILDDPDDYNLTGKYLYRRVRHLIDYYFTEPRKYFKNGKSMVSKVMVNQDCPLTGVYTDHVILSPIFSYIEGKLKVNNYYKLIEYCLDSADKFFNESEEYFSSEEYIKGILEDQDDYYTIDGTIINY